MNILVFLIIKWQNRNYWGIWILKQHNDIPYVNYKEEFKKPI